MQQAHPRPPFNTNCAVAIRISHPYQRVDMVSASHVLTDMGYILSASAAVFLTSRPRRPHYTASLHNLLAVPRDKAQLGGGQISIARHLTWGTS